MEEEEPEREMQREVEEGSAMGGSEDGWCSMRAARHQAEIRHLEELQDMRQVEAEKRRHPDMPRTYPRLPRGEDVRQMSAIDEVPVEQCALATVGVVNEVPEEHWGDWQTVLIDIGLEMDRADRMKEASLEVEGELEMAAAKEAMERVQDRALKWSLAAAQILLRGPKKLKGGRRGQKSAARKEMRDRFRWWQKGERGKLVDDWLQARAEAEEATEMRRAESRWQVETGADVASEFQNNLEAAMEAGRDGALGKATGLLVSNGVAKLVCEITGQEGIRGCGCGGCANMRKLASRFATRRGVLPLPAA